MTIYPETLKLARDVVSTIGLETNPRARRDLDKLATALVAAHEEIERMRGTLAESPRTGLKTRDSASGK